MCARYDLNICMYARDHSRHCALTSAVRTPLINFRRSKVARIFGMRVEAMLLRLRRYFIQMPLLALSSTSWKISRSSAFRPRNLHSVRTHARVRK